MVLPSLNSHLSSFSSQKDELNMKSQSRKKGHNWDEINRKLKTGEMKGNWGETSCRYSNENLKIKENERSRLVKNNNQNYDIKSWKGSKNRKDRMVEMNIETEVLPQICVKNRDNIPVNRIYIKDGSPKKQEADNNRLQQKRKQRTSENDMNISKMIIHKIGVILDYYEQNTSFSAKAKSTYAIPPLDSNRLADLSEKHHKSECKRQHSETTVKEICVGPVEHEEDCEKSDMSKDELLDQISGDFNTQELLTGMCRKLKAADKQNCEQDLVDILLHLVTYGYIDKEHIMNELNSIIKNRQPAPRRSSRSMSTCMVRLEKVEDKEENEDVIKSDKRVQDLTSSSNNDVVHTKCTSGKKCVKDIQEFMNEWKKTETNLKEHEVKQFDLLMCRTDIFQDEEKAVKSVNHNGKYSISIKEEPKCDKMNERAISEKVSSGRQKKHNGKKFKVKSNKNLCKENCRKDNASPPLVLKQKPSKNKRIRNQSIKQVDRTIRYSRRQELKPTNYKPSVIKPKIPSSITVVRKRRHKGTCSAGGGMKMVGRHKGDNPSGSELTDSDPDRHSSRGSQKSDDQEETEKEKLGRRQDDEKDRDENADLDNGYGSTRYPDRISSNVDMVARFKYRRKHGSLSGGKTELSDILGLMLNETDDLKVPPDKFEEINLCLMTSMQVKNAGETTTCFICTHLSSLISHFGSCSMGYQQFCSLCKTLFKFIQKHVATCGLSDSLTAEVTCPVIICIKLKSAEFAAIDNAEKVWKKLKKSLARFANPDFIDDNSLLSGGDFPSLRNSSLSRPSRLSVASRSVLESIPETGIGNRVSLAGTRQKPETKPFSRSEPIMRKNPDGSTVITANLPRRLQQDDFVEKQPSSLPPPRQRSVTHGSVSRPNYFDTFTDSTDHPLPSPRAQSSIPEDSVFDAAASDTASDARGRLSSEIDGLVPNSLSEQDSLTGSDTSMPGHVYGYGDCTTSLQHGIRRPEIGERYRSLWDRAIGIPGIQDVVYGERSCLVQVAQIWSNMKSEHKNGRKHDLREEGVILPAYKDRLKILKMRYSKNFQWVRLSHLGSGMSGKCHLAMDFNTEFKFCIKKIHISKYEVKEIEIWSELRHKNIVQLIGTLRRGEKIYILSEFIDGGCLTETIMMHRTMNRRLSQWTAVNYLKQILEALVYLKKKYVIHEDLKSDNILVRSGTKDIVITDFGVARKLTSETDGRGATPSGSQIVFSPEKARGQGHGYKSDLWSAICVMVHMLTGYPPWVRRYPNIGALIYVIIEEHPEIPTNINEDVTDLIRRGFNKDPAKRPGPEELLQHKAFRILDGYIPETYYSTLRSAAPQMDTVLPPINEKDQQEDIVQEIIDDMKSLNISPEERMKLQESMAEPKRTSEETADRGNKNNSSIDFTSMAIKLGISLPEEIAVIEKETPQDLYREFLFDTGQVTMTDQELEELLSSPENQSSEEESSKSDIEFEMQPHSDLPNFMLLFPKDEILTEKEKEDKKAAEAIVEQYHESILTHQLSQTGSQHNQSFDSYSSIRSTSAENLQAKIVEQLTISSRPKESLDVPYLTVFNESSSTSSSEKVTLKTNLETLQTLKTDNAQPLTAPPSLLVISPFSPKVEQVQRPKSASPSMSNLIFSIEEEIDDENLFGSGEGKELLQNKGTEDGRSGESSVKKTVLNKNPDLHLDLSPATRRKKYATGNSRSDPNTASIDSTDKSPLPPTKPYFTPQIQRPPPFLSILKQSKMSSGLGSSLGKSPPLLHDTENTSGAWSSPKSQQDEQDELLGKYLEELSNTSGTEVQLSAEGEDHAKFGLGLDEDDEASMLYIQQQYLNEQPSSNGHYRLTVHYKPGNTFTMEIPGLLVKQQWKEIIKECSDYIHGMGVSKFLLLDDNKEVLDLQKSPSQGELLVYVQEVDETSSVPWYCEAGMII